MRAVTIGQNEAGQRLDKFLNKYMKEAGVSFFYKMMRKKNIVLNGKKCTGKEILLIGDEVKLFLAEETLEKFGALTEQEREKLRQRAARAADFTAMREIVSDFVGWQEGHGPYQL